MELYQLRTFLAVARTGNLTRAAELLNASQPTVSAQVKALEDAFGVVLFSRTSRGMELTGAGELLRAKAEEVDVKASELIALAATLTGKVVGGCRIGLNTEAGVLRIPELVDALGVTAPDLKIELVQGVTRSILEDVTVGRLNAGFAFGSERRELKAVALARMELVIAVPASWRERLESASWVDCLRESWVWPPQDCPFHEKAVALFRNAGRIPPQGVIADHESTLLRLVCAGVGLALLPSFMVKEAQAKGEVVPVRVPRSEIELLFVWRARDESAPFLKLVLEGLRAVWRTGDRPRG
jgi:DNA-binding transcriptional LysR family regulator